jgi:hypothetical protein
MQIQAYRNLNKPGYWTIKARQAGKWQVIGHATAVTMAGVTPRYSEKSRQAVIASGQRSVHCWVYGELLQVEGFIPFKDRAKLEGLEMFVELPPNMSHISYNPHFTKTFEYKCNGQAWHGSEFVLLDNAMHMYSI